MTKSDVMELLHLDANQAYYQLRKLVREGRAQKSEAAAVRGTRQRGNAGSGTLECFS